MLQLRPLAYDWVKFAAAVNLKEVQYFAQYVRYSHVHYSIQQPLKHLTFYNPNMQSSCPLIFYYSELTALHMMMMIIFILLQNICSTLTIAQHNVKLFIKF